MNRAVIAALLLAVSACFSKPGFTGGEGDDGPPPTYGAMTLGARHACGLDGGTLYCWGDNSNKQLGIAGAEVALQPTRAHPEIADWNSIVAGARHTCGVRNGVPSCWGDNSHGQVLGASGGDVEAATMPRMDPAVLAPSFLYLVAGAQHTCALSNNGQIWCWGDPAQVTKSVSFATRIDTTGDFYDLDAGRDHTCGIAGDRMGTAELRCWGANPLGQCGQPVTATVNTPTVVAFPSNLVPLKLALGSEVSCSILGTFGVNQGELWCWGSNAGGVISPAATAYFATPVRVGTSEDWQFVVLGQGVACGFRDNVVSCWGSGDHGITGGGVWDDDRLPLDLARRLPSTNDLALSKSTIDSEPYSEFGCLRLNNQISCWGNDAYGTLGDGTRSMQPRPVEIAPPADRTWDRVWAGSEHTCATTDDGALWCWGADFVGQVSAGPGYGTSAQPCIDNDDCDRPTPIRAPAPITDPDELVGGAQFTCARQGTKIRCWGQNTSGELGVDPPAGHTVQSVREGTTWLQLTGGPRGACGRTSGGIDCWGRVNDITTRTPVRLTDPAQAGLQHLSLADGFACGRDGSNRVCWGSNASGEHGSGDTSPVTIVATYTGAEDMREVRASGSHACALVDSPNGKIRCWGRNVDGESGAPASTSVTAPRFVLEPDDSELENCTALSLGPQHACAICSNQVWCWGQNNQNQLGRGPSSTPVHLPVAVNLPSPAPVRSLATGTYHTCTTTDDNRLFCWGGGDHGQLGDGGRARNLPELIGPRL